MRHLLLTALFGVLFMFTACQKESIDTSPDSKVMSFATQIEDIDKTSTRGTPITAVTQMTSMGVFAYNTGSSIWAEAVNPTSNYMHNQLITRSGGKWSYEPVKYWPKSNTSLFAYAPYATADNGITVQTTPYTGAPTIEYIVPTTCANQPDLMVALRKTDMSSGTATMEMKHALSCLSFKVRGTGGNEKIINISVKGISGSGTLSLDYTSGAPVWSNLSTPTNTEYTSGVKDNLVAGSEMIDATTDNGYLMMIPQTLGAGAKIVVTVNGDEKREVSITGITWEAGKRYVVTLTIKPQEIEVVITSITIGDWVEDNKYDVSIDTVTEPSLNTGD